MEDRTDVCEKGADDLRIAEKFQSNSEIAGSPRNRFRPSLELFHPGGRALNVEWPRLAVLTAINLRMPGIVDSGVSV